MPSRAPSSSAICGEGTSGFSTRNKSTAWYIGWAAASAFQVRSSSSARQLSRKSASVSGTAGAGLAGSSRGQGPRPGSLGRTIVVDQMDQCGLQVIAEATAAGIGMPEGAPENPQRELLRQLGSRVRVADRP